MKFFFKSFAFAFALTTLLLMVVHAAGAAINGFPFGYSFSGIITGGGTTSVTVFFVCVLMFSLTACLPVALGQVSEDA